MNNTFANYSRSTAFNVTMNRQSIGLLLDMLALTRRIRELGRDDVLVEKGLCLEGISNIRISYLERRGLVERAPMDCRLTKAGELMGELLCEAGFHEIYEYHERQYANMRTFIMGDNTINIS